MSDEDLAQHQNGLMSTEQAVTARLAATREAARSLADRFERDSGEAVARLTTEGAAPELIERAMASGAEDVVHARETANAARDQLESVKSRIQQVATEVERRAALTPQERQAEQAVRRQHVAQRPSQTTQVSPPPPKITGPEGPSRGGASL